MNQLTIAQEQKLLHECIENNRKDLFIREYWTLIYHVVKKTIRLFPILRDKYSDESEIKMLRNEIILKLFEKDCQRLKSFKHKFRIRLSSWIIMLTARLVMDFLKKEVLRLTESTDSEEHQLSQNDYCIIDGWIYIDNLQLSSYRLVFTQGKDELGSYDFELNEAGLNEK